MEIINLFIPTDIIFKILLSLDFKNALELSKSNKIFYNTFITNEQLWEQYLLEIIKVENKELLWTNDYKQTFKKCYQINKIKSFYILNDDISTIYIKIIFLCLIIK